MALTEGSLIEVTLNMFYNGLHLANVWSYEITLIAPGVSAENVGEGWWNHVKDEYRAITRSAPGFFEFQSVGVRQVDDPLGSVGEFAIPSGETVGTRVGVDTSEFLPPYNAAGVRLTVGERVTRPGQKRIPGLLEVDNENSSLQAGIRGIVEDLMDVMVAGMTLGAPALGTDMGPRVFKKDGTGVVTAQQAITGYVINPYVTSQVSRKY